MNICRFRFNIYKRFAILYVYISINRKLKNILHDCSLFICTSDRYTKATNAVILRRRGGRGKNTGIFKVRGGRGKKQVFSG